MATQPTTTADDVDGATAWYTGETIVDFINYASRIPLLSSYEEQTLAARIKAGDRRAVDSLVYHNQLLVVGPARAWAGTHPDWWPDLWQAGQIGLWRAAQKYDGRGRFSTYGMWWVYQGVGREGHRLMRSSIQIPEGVEEDAGKVNRAVLALAREGITHPTAEQVCQQAGIAMKDYEKVLDIPRAMLLLSQPLGESHSHSAGGVGLQMDDALEFGETLADAWEGSEEQERELIDTIDQTDAWSQIAEELSPREVEVLQIHYAFDGLADGEREKAMRALATKWGVTRSRVRQVCKEATLKLFLVFYLDEDGHLARREAELPVQQKMMGW